MCGIAGLLGEPGDPQLIGIVGQMTSALRHRGPDDEGSWNDINLGIALGHRRLAIVDLSSSGHQPMLSNDGRFVITFNGEIYNHAEIRKELEASGRTCWRGHSDTEVAIEAIAGWGLDVALSKFVGMFAIALWDKAERQLYLVRDRLGEKPLYFGWIGKYFAFASELKAFRSIPRFAREVHRGSLALYLRYMYVPGPYTIYRGVYKLQPGHVLSVHCEAALKTIPASIDLRTPFSNDGVQLRQYWSLKDRAEQGQLSKGFDETESLEGLERRLIDAAKAQSMADVPLGAFLSGGVDSSLIAALMQSHTGSRVKTFTIGFRERDYNEAGYARHVAAYLGTDHTELFVSAADALRVVSKLPEMYDEPFADSSQVPTALLCSQARSLLTVAVSGDGGDELFGGYNRYFWSKRIWSRIAWLPPAGRKMFARAIVAIPAKSWSSAYSSLEPMLPATLRVSTAGDKLHKLAERLETVIVEDDLFHSLISEWKRPSEVVVGGYEPLVEVTDIEAWPKMESLEARMMYLDSVSYLPDDILVKLDRAAMATSLETRAPFLDHRVAEFAWTLPMSMKIRDGSGKWALRKILYKYVPRELIERPKQGFGMPLAEWLRGPLREWADQLLAPSRLAREGYLRPEPICAKWKEHVSGARNWEYPLWAVLMFQSWLECNA